MNKVKKLLVLGVLLLMIIIPFGSNIAFASETGTEYITISVDATDDNDNLQYAIDEPVNFSSVNTFTIPAGTSHTIYVKDAAGNITSQEYYPQGNGSVVGQGSLTTPQEEGAINTSIGEGEQEINIELELGMDADKIMDGTETNSRIPSTGDNKNYEYLTDTVIEDAPVTVQSKTTTDGTDTAEKVFYTITTAEGETFYLVIDQGNSNTVHLLNTVTTDDLQAIAATSENSNTSIIEEEEDNLLEALNSNAKTAESNTQTAVSPQKSSNSKILIIIVFALAVGGYYYYTKVYKKKKEDAMDMTDAMDIDEFALEEDEEEDDELLFDDDEKQRMLDNLIESDEYEDQEEGNEFVNEEPNTYNSQEDQPVADTYKDTYNQKKSQPVQEDDRHIIEETHQKEVQIPVYSGEDEIQAALAAAQEIDEELDGEEDE